MNNLYHLTDLYKTDLFNCIMDGKDIEMLKESGEKKEERKINLLMKIK